MSLAQRVTQVEGFDYEGPANPAVHHDHHPDGEFGTANLLFPDATDDNNKSEWRRLSLAPVDVTKDEPLLKEAAYKVSDVKRVAQVATAVIACWLASGIVFGFAALKPVLVAEGVYSDLCPLEHVKVATDAVPCAEQDLRLNLFFIAASITANVSSLFAGTVLDRYGRRTCWVMSSMFLSIGSILMAISAIDPELDGYLVANVFLALGGTFVFVPSFQLANAFPKYSGLIVALVTGAFDASAAVYLFYRMAYDASDGALSLEKFYLGYLVVPVLILVAEFSLMPRHAYHSIPQLEEKIERAQDPICDVHDSDDDISDARELDRVRSARADRRLAKLDQIEELAGDAEVRDERVKMEEARQETSGVWGVLHGVAAHRQMMTPWFVLVLVLTVLQMLRMNYFIATIRAQYRYILGSEEASEKINDFFDIALPVGGMASTPFIGMLLNNMSIPAVFGVMTVFIIAMGVLNCLPFVWAGYTTVVIFVLFRPLYYSAISDYATKVFGFATFGRIYGTITCLSGLANFGQSGLDALTHGSLQGDPTPINIVLGGAGTLVCVVLTVFVAVKGKEFVDEKADIEADHERQRLLSQDCGGYGTPRRGA